jgi:molybdopterin/thiamine biosynthesis adenylyltransferase
MTARDVTSFRALAVDFDDVIDRPGLVVVDELALQLEQLAAARAPGEDDAPEPVAASGTWFLYPWRRELVRVLPAPLHRELRLDRNRYAITAAEERRLGELTIAVAGLSVGRAVVSTLAHEGIGGELRLADFDVLDLSNLNRVPGGVADLGVGKVVLAAREVAELDPYLRVETFERGVEDATIAAFVAGADVIVDECDDLAIKLLLREHARAAGVPVVMATSHRGMLDVERYDLEPEREPFHGLLGGITSAELRGLTTKQKVPYVTRLLDPEGLTHRAAASLVEVRQTLSTWPQLASDVALGGAMVANAIRRMAVGGFTASGRFYADLDELVADGRQAPVRPVAKAVPAPARPAPPCVPSAGDLAGAARFVVACASSAPSGGNMQPWRFQARANVIRAWADPARSSLLDFRGRATLLALGAALEAAEIGARALGYAPVARIGSEPLWELELRPGNDGRDPACADVLWQRSSNRRTGASPPLSHAELLRLAAHSSPLEANVVVQDRLPSLGAALGALDRIRFLSARLRHDMIGELRFGSTEALATGDGIDVASLELDAADRAAMDVLRTGAGMDVLAALDRGWGLAKLARDAFTGSGGALVLRAPATDATAMVECGRGLMRLWLEATRRDLAVHPWGSPFLFQRLLEDPGSLEPWERESLERAAGAFELDRDRPILLVLRLSRFAQPSVRSLRRPLDDVLETAGTASASAV